MNAQKQKAEAIGDLVSSEAVKSANAITAYTISVFTTKIPIAAIFILLCGSALAQVPPFPIVAPPPPFHVTITWDTAPDVAGVKLYSGSDSRAYTYKVDVGFTNKATVQIAYDCPVYFAVTAYNLLVVESDYSAEVSWTPPPMLTNVIVTVTLPILTSTNLLNWEATNFVVFALTNPPGNRFWRAQELKISAVQF